MSSRSMNGSQTSIGMHCARNAWERRSSHPRTKITSMRSTLTVSGKTLTPSRCFKIRQSSNAPASKNSSRDTITIRQSLQLIQNSMARRILVIISNVVKKLKTWLTAHSSVVQNNRAQLRREASLITALRILMASNNSAITRCNSQAISTKGRTFQILGRCRITQPMRVTDSHKARWLRAQLLIKCLEAEAKCMGQTWVWQHQLHTNTAHIIVEHQTTPRTPLTCMQDNRAAVCFTTRMPCQHKIFKWWHSRTMVAVSLPILTFLKVRQRA